LVVFHDLVAYGLRPANEQPALDRVAKIHVRREQRPHIHLAHTARSYGPNLLVLERIEIDDANAPGSRLHFRMHLAHGWIIEHKRAALGAPDVHTLHVDRNAGGFAYDLDAAPPQGQDVGLPGHRGRVVRVDVSDHVHLTCLLPQADPCRLR
jgi:hypothetical protein